VSIAGIYTYARARVWIYEPLTMGRGELRQKKNAVRYERAK